MTRRPFVQTEVKSKPKVPKPKWEEKRSEGKRQLKWDTSRTGTLAEPGYWPKWDTSRSGTLTEVGH